MKNTSHLGLKKPGNFDLYAVQEFNYNAEVIDEAIKNTSAMGAEVVSHGTGRYLQSTQNNMTGFYDANAYIGANELIVENIPTMSTRTELVRFAGLEYTEIKVLEVGVATGTYFIWSENTEPFTIEVQYSIMTADGTGERLIGNVTKEISNIVPNVSNAITMEVPIEHHIAIGEQLIHRIYVTTPIMNQKISIAFGGVERPSRFIIPLTMGHNDLAGLQGGVAGEYYHLSKTQHDKNLLNDGEGSGLFNMFTEADTRENLASGERQNISFGKMKKWFTDLKAVAWSGNASDLVEDESNRLVTDSEKSTWNAKASTAVVTTSTNGLMISTDKSKLDSIASGANNYVHPSTHPASIIVQDANNRFTTDSEKTTWNGKLNQINDFTAASTSYPIPQILRDVYSYTNDASTVTGTMKIVLPHSWTNTMLNVEIDGYQHGLGSFKYILGGYNYAPSTAWSSASASALGSAPSTSVRFGHDGTKCCILIGTTTSTWQYPKIAISRLSTGYQNASNNNWDKNWSISFLTSESGVVVTSNPTCKVDVKTTDITNWNGKASTAVATTTANGLMSSTDKSKLDGMASGANNYVHPTTHPPSIITQDASNRFVTDTDKTNWNAKASTAVATTTANGLMASVDKSKLDGMASGANNYVHPSTHPASIIVQDANNRFATDSEKSTWNAKASTAVATTTANGLMSSTDKTKLDGIASGANNYVHPSTHPASIIVQDANNRFATDAEKSTWNGKASTAVATTSANGLMASADKSKLDGIASSANNYVHPSTHPASVIVQDASNRFVSDSEKSTWNGKANKSNGANEITDSSAYSNLGTAANATQKTINAAINSRIASGGSDLVIPIGGSLDITKSDGTIYPAIEASGDGMILDSTDGDLFIGGSSTRDLYLGGTSTYATNLVLQGDITSSEGFNQGSWNTPKSGMITQVTDNSNAQHSVIVGLKSDGITRSYGMDILDSDTNMQMRLYAGNDYLEINDSAGGIVGSGHIRAAGMLKGNGARVLLKSEYVCSYMEVGQAKDISIPSNCVVTKIEFNWSDYDTGTSQMNGYHFDTTTVSEGKVYTKISGTTTTYDVLTSGVYDSTYLLTGNSPESGGGVSEIEIVNKGLTLKVNYSTDKLELDGITQNSSNGNYDDIVLNSVNIYGYYTS